VGKSVKSGLKGGERERERERERDRDKERAGTDQAKLRDLEGNERAEVKG